MSTNIQEQEWQYLHEYEDGQQWEWEDEEEMRDAYPESCIFGGAYSPGTETCDMLCKIGPCMTDNEYAEMMEDEYRYQRHLDRKEQMGWRGKFWRGWYHLKYLFRGLRYKLPKIPKLETCEVCGSQYWHIKNYAWHPACSDHCFTEWLPF